MVFEWYFEWIERKESVQDIKSISVLVKYEQSIWDRNQKKSMGQKMAQACKK